jgi:hypothetical protein
MGLPATGQVTCAGGDDRARGALESALAARLEKPFSSQKWLKGNK